MLLMTALFTAISWAANSTFNHTTYTPTATSVDAAASTKSLLSHLWSGISVSSAEVTHVVEPMPIPGHETANPPNLPEFTSEERLPPNFIWGMASTAGQVEGAADADGKGPSVWDNVAHRVSGFIAENETLDVTANHYYLYKQDAARLKELEVPYYSMSIAWSRIFPLGNGSVNQAGLQHYVDEIDHLLSLNITPIVTMYHWDIPQNLQNAYGGFLSEQVIEDFANYARVLFDAFADKVKIWITMNEPQVFCNDYMEWPESVPDDVFPVHGVKSRVERLYKCGHNAILAHAKVAEIFRQEYKPKHGGLISFANSWDFTPPLTGSAEDRKASLRTLAFNAGWIGNPIYVDGEYPMEMRRALGDLLPKFTAEQKQQVFNSTDFYAWDSYTGYPVRAVEGFDQCVQDKNHDAWPLCSEDLLQVPGNGWLVGNEADVEWLHDTPQLFRQGVLWSWEFFKPSGYFLPEFGFAPWKEGEKGVNRARYDDERVNYYQGYMNQILQLVNRDFVNLIGAIGWSAMDNLEWREGTQRAKFGMQHVNYTTQQRQYKKSAFFFRDFFQYYVET